MSREKFGKLVIATMKSEYADEDVDIVLFEELVFDHDCDKAHSRKRYACKTIDKKKRIAKQSRKVVMVQEDIAPEGYLWTGYTNKRGATNFALVEKKMAHINRINSEIRKEIAEYI